MSNGVLELHHDLLGDLDRRVERSQIRGLQRISGVAKCLLGWTDRHVRHGGSGFAFMPKFPLISCNKFNQEISCAFESSQDRMHDRCFRLESTASASDEGRRMESRSAPRPFPLRSALATLALECPRIVAGIIFPQFPWRQTWDCVPIICRKQASSHALLLVREI